MNRIILGLVAATAVAAPIGSAVGSASAATVSSAPDCVPVKAAPALTHVEYKYKPAVNGSGPTHWSKDNAPTLTVDGIKYKNAGVTRVIEDVPAVLEDVNCAVQLPWFEAVRTPQGEISATVPMTAHVQTRLYGVQGHPETDPITTDVKVTPNMVGGQFWIGYTLDEGYVAANAGQTHIDFNASFPPVPAVPAANEVRLDGEAASQVSKTIELADEFPTKHTEYPEGTYYSTQVEVTITNTSAVDKAVNVMFADVQDGDRVWIERGVFKDEWVHWTTISANSSKTFVFDVWYNVVTESPDVPDDLKLDFGVEATPLAA